MGWGGMRRVEGAFFARHATTLPPLNKIYTGNVTFELNFVYLSINLKINVMKHFKIGDKVRYITNQSAFDKKSLPQWCTKVHTISDNNIHSYQLDNEKWYQYYLIKTFTRLGIFYRTRPKMVASARLELKNENSK